MERMSGPPYWLDLEDCRYYISQRVAPDPETRKIWEHNEAEAAIADARAYLALVEVDNRRLKREAKEKEDTAKFEAAKRDAVRPPRFEVLRRLHFTDTTRDHLTMTWVVSFSSLRLRAGQEKTERGLRRGGRPHDD